MDYSSLLGGGGGGAPVSSSASAGHNTFGDSNGNWIALALVGLVAVVALVLALKD